MVDETEHICRSRRPISTCWQVLQPPDAQPPDVQPPDARFQPVSSVSPAHRSSPPGCRSLCSSPARAVHPREACIHSDLIEDKLCALISFVLGATLAADGGGRSRCCCSLPGSLCCPCCSREAAATLCRCCSSSTSRAGRRVVTPAALQATPRPAGDAAPSEASRAACPGRRACARRRASVLPVSVRQ